MEEDCFREAVASKTNKGTLTKKSADYKVCKTNVTATIEMAGF